jgi:hypothetical protein
VALLKHGSIFGLLKTMFWIPNFLPSLDGRGVAPTLLDPLERAAAMAGSPFHQRMGTYPVSKTLYSLEF